MIEEKDKNFEKLYNDVNKGEQQVAESEYPHITIMREENIKRKDLPKDIQDSIKYFSITKGKLNLNQLKNRDKIEAQAMNLSIIISDKIMDYLDKDLPQRESGGEVEEKVETAKKEVEEVVDEVEEDVEEEVEDIEDIEEEDIEEKEDNEPKSKELPKKEKESSSFDILGGIFDW